MVTLRYREIAIDRGTARVVERVTDTESWTDNHVVLRPERVGVCRSDLKELAGRRHLRRDFGHEVIAEVVHAPAGLSVSPGHWVCLDPHVPVDRGSGFSELLVLRGRRDDLDTCVVDLGRVRPEPTSVFTEPLACVEHALAAMAPEPGSKWLILGAGHAGFLMYACLRTAGHEVTLANRSVERLTALTRTGVLAATDVVPFGDVPRSGFDGACVATAMSYPDVLDAAARAVTPNGRVHIYGGTEPSWPAWWGCDIDRLRRTHGRDRVRTTWGTLRLSGSHGARPEHFRSAVHRLGIGEPTPSPLDRMLGALLGPELGLEALCASLNAAGSFRHTTKTVLRLSPSSATSGQTGAAGADRTTDRRRAAQ